MALQLHALRSRLCRLGAENLATPRQPVRPEVVTHVLVQFVIYVSGLDRQGRCAAEGIRTPDPRITNWVALSKRALPHANTASLIFWHKALQCLWLFFAA
jgi:hypothetical protein